MSLDESKGVAIVQVSEDSWRTGFLGFFEGDKLPQIDLFRRPVPKEKVERWLQNE